LSQWPVAHYQIVCSSPHHGRALKVEYLGKFESTFKTALDHESADQSGTSGEITLDKNLTLISFLRIHPSSINKYITQGQEKSGS
jgi:hypothetical protein